MIGSPLPKFMFGSVVGLIFTRSRYLLQFILAALVKKLLEIMRDNSHMLIN